MLRGSAFTARNLLKVGAGVHLTVGINGNGQLQRGNEMDTEPAVIDATIHTLRTRVDGTLSVTLEIEPRNAGKWVQAFGTMPGTPVAVARLNLSQPKPGHEQGEYGHIYKSLYVNGWFNNPRVRAAFEVDQSVPTDTATSQIKQQIYELFNVESLTQVEPYDFVHMCILRNIGNTLPNIMRSWLGVE